MKWHLNSDKKAIPLHLIYSQLLRNKLKKYNHPHNIIIVVREPIARLISSVMQNSEILKSEYEDENLNLNTDKIIKNIKLYIDNENICDELVNWFDEEIKASYEIEVFQEQFNDTQGYVIYRNEHANILLFKMETMNMNYKKAIKDFIGIDIKSNLRNENTSNSKFYSTDSDIVKSTLKISKESLSLIKASKYFQYFYASDSSIDLSHWESK
jgi:hypothetical protein